MTKCQMGINFFLKTCRRKAIEAVYGEVCRRIPDDNDWKDTVVGSILMWEVEPDANDITVCSFIGDANMSSTLNWLGF